MGADLLDELFGVALPTRVAPREDTLQEDSSGAPATELQLANRPSVIFENPALLGGDALDDPLAQESAVHGRRSDVEVFFVELKVGLSKPANVAFVREPEAWVSGFGLGRPLEDEERL
jgi:hypothetical protein